MTRLPTPGGDDSTWGNILNDFLTQVHNPDGTLKSSVVGTNQLQTNAVSTPQLADGSVTNPKLDVPTQTTLASVSSKYTKPASGIPGSDIASTTITDANISSTAAIARTKLDASTQASLTTADNRDAVKLQGTAINGSVPANTQVLQYSSASSAWVPATVTSTTVTDATTGTKGIIQLSGDLGGTATAPTVPGLAATEKTANKGAANGYAPLDASSKVPAANLPPASANTLASDTDVTIATPATGQVLTYDATASKWKNQTAPTASNATTTTPGLIQLSGDLGGTATSPTVAKLSGGIVLPGTAPSSTGQVLTTTSSGSSATTAWSTPSAGITLDTTTTDIAPLGTQSAGAIGKAADAGHVHAMPSASQIGALAATNNLSDLTDPEAAKYNLAIPAMTAKAVITTNVASLSGIPAASVTDSYQTVATDPVLLTAQTTSSQNGLWLVQSGAWTRPTSFPANGTISRSRTVTIGGGTTYAGTAWVLPVTAPITIDTTSQAWTLRPITAGQLPGSVVSGSQAAGGATTASAGRTSTIAAPVLRDFVSVMDAPFGAVGDAKVLTNGSISSGSNQLSSASYSFTSFDVNKAVLVVGAGANVQPGFVGPSTPGMLVTTITSVSGGVATLATNALATVSGAIVKFGTDDTAAWQNAINTVSSSGGGNLLAPSGFAFILGTLTPKSNVSIWMYGATMHLKLNGGALFFSGFYPTIGISHFELRGGIFPGTGLEAGNSGNQGIIYFYPANAVAYYDINVYDAYVTNWATGVWDIRGGTRVRISNNTVLTSCTFTGTNTINIGVIGGSGATVPTSEIWVQNNYIDNCGAEAIAIGNAGNTTTIPTSVIITGNNVQVVGGATGINIEWSTTTTGTGRDFIIANNTVRNSGSGTSAYGIGVNVNTIGNNNPMQLSRAIVQGNIVDSSAAGGNGILIASSDTIVSDNFVFSAGGYALVLEAAGTFSATADESSTTTLSNVSASANIANGSQISGPGIQGGTYLVSGAGSNTWTISLPATLTGPGQAITVYSQIKRIQVKNNILRTGINAGLGIWANSVRNSVISGNIISTDAGSTTTSLGLLGSGIFVQNCGWLDIHDNRIEYSPTYGILITTSNDFTLLRNRIYNPCEAGAGQGYGVDITQISGKIWRIEGNIIQDDRLSSKMQYGLIITSSANGFIHLLRNEVRGASVSAYSGTWRSAKGNISDVSNVINAAASLTLPIPGDAIWTVNGSTAITTIGIQPVGAEITLVFAGAGTINSGGILKLSGNFNTSSSGGSLTLVSDGTNWWEKARVYIA